MNRFLVHVEELAETVDRIAVDTAFSGAVRVDHHDDLVLAKAYGHAHRAHRIAADGPFECSTAVIVRQSFSTPCISMTGEAVPVGGRSR